MRNFTLLVTVFVFIIFSKISIAQPFAALQNIDANTGNEPYELESGDLDGDGDTDLAMGTYDANASPPQDFLKWYSNDGNGNFTLETTVSSDITFIDGLAVGNLDNLNGEDIIVASANQNKISLFFSDGNGGFDNEIILDAAINGVGEVVVSDIDNDGNLDIIAVSYTDNKTVWYSGDGAGNFSGATDIENATTDGPYYLDIGDFDDDGDNDLVVGYFNTQSIEIFYNQFIESGTNTVSWVQDAVTVEDESGSSFILEVRFADVDNDGVMEIIKTNNSGAEVSYYDKIVDGVSTETIITNAPVSERPGKTLVVDLDGDGLNDVIVANSLPSDEELIYFVGADNASPSATPILIADNNFIVFDLVAADFDSDGDLDIASLGNGADRLDWYENQRIELSLNNQIIEKFNIYPNPTSNNLNFKGLVNQTTNIQIFDMLGKSVLDTTVSQNESLNVSQLKPGVYAIKIANKEITKKFIKQ